MSITHAASATPNPAPADVGAASATVSARAGAGPTAYVLPGLGGGADFALAVNHAGVVGVYNVAGSDPFATRRAFLWRPAVGRPDRDQVVLQQ